MISLRRAGLLMVILLSGVVLSACQLPIPWKKQVAGLQVQLTDGQSAQVYLDDLHLGQTPLQLQNLKPGVKKLRLEPTGTGKQAYATDIHLYPGSISSVLWNFAGTDPTGTGDILELEPLPSAERAELSVITVPEGASVLLNTTSYGLSPVILDEVSPGDYSLSMNAVAHVQKTLSVKIQPGYRLHVFSRLEKEGGNGGSGDKATSGQPSGQAGSNNQTGTSTATSGGRLARPTPAATPTASPVATPTNAPVAAPRGSASPTPVPSPTVTPRTMTRQPAKPYVTITETGTGWLRVRAEASSAGAEVARVNVGDSFAYKSTLNGWYEIEYEPGKTGWISGQFGKLER